MFGEYAISHINGVCKVQKLDVDEDIVYQSMRNDSGILSTTKHAVVEARRGQGMFRNRLIELDKHCQITGINKPDFLRASHIKPWTLSSDIERLDPNNGLLLSPHLDLLFDGGWVTFDHDGNCKCSSQETVDALNVWKIDIPFTIGVLSVERALYMDFHNRFVFKGDIDACW